MSLLLRRAGQVGQLTRTLGPRWLARRLAYSMELRLGLLRRRLPVANWCDRSLQVWLGDPTLAEPAAYLHYRRSQAPRFFFAPGDRLRYAPLLTTWDHAASNPCTIADEI